MGGQHRVVRQLVVSACALVSMGAALGAASTANADAPRTSVLSMTCTTTCPPTLGTHGGVQLDDMGNPGALIDSLGASGQSFAHDKIEGMARFDGCDTLVISNDSDLASTA